MRVTRDDLRAIKALCSVDQAGQAELEVGLPLGVVLALCRKYGPLPLRTLAIG